MDLISHDQLCENLEYDPINGGFVWKVDRGVLKCKNKKAGSYHTKGYRVIGFEGKNYKEHRLVWFYHTRKWPDDQIDHINRIKDDNRIENLRECTTSQNCQNRKKQINNTSGHTGVNWSKQCQKWRVEICINRKNKYLGFYDNFEKAVEVYKEAKKKYHKFQPQ